MSVTQTIEIVFHRRCLMFNRVLNLFVDGVLFSLVSEAGTRWCSVRKLFLEISQNSQESTCVGVSFLMKSYRPEACKFIKKELQRRCFPLNFAKFLRTPFFVKHLWWLLLSLLFLVTLSTIIWQIVGKWI